MIRSNLICITHIVKSKGARHIAGSSHIVYITRYTPRGKTRSDRPFSPHYASIPKQIKVTVHKHILCDN